MSVTHFLLHRGLPLEPHFEKVWDGALIRIMLATLDLRCEKWILSLNLFTFESLALFKSALRASRSIQ